MISLDPSKPVVLLLTGEPGTGKSTLAGAVAPPLSSSVMNMSDDVVNPWNRHPIHWHEFSILPPLQALYAARTRVEGEHVQERQKYLILETLLQLFNHSPLYGAPSFSTLVDMVYQLVQFNPGDNYMDQARSLIEDHDPDALYKYMERAINNRFALYKSELTKDLEDLEEEHPDKAFAPKLFGVVLSDISSQAEARYIRSAFENIVTLRLSCDEDVRLDRLDDEAKSAVHIGFPLGDYTVTLDTTTKVERMVLDGDPLPITDDDNRRGKKKGVERCISRLKGEEFETLLSNFRSIFQTESQTYAQDQ